MNPTTREALRKQFIKNRAKIHQLRDKIKRMERDIEILEIENEDIYKDMGEK